MAIFITIPLGLKYMNLVETLIEPNVENLPFVGKLVQPINQNNNDTGPAAPSTILKATPDYEGFATVAFW
ncbi:unnamed protein product [Hanseniaspora opuntiae]